MITRFGSSLRDIDETNVNTLFEFLGFVTRQGAGKGDSAPENKPARASETLTIGGKAYKRVSAENASWLR